MARPKSPLSRQRIAYSQAREQALWRGESWRMTWEEWWQMWQANWQNRGRGREDLVMMRVVPERGWSTDNCEIVTRITYLRRCREYRGG